MGPQLHEVHQLRGRRWGAKREGRGEEKEDEGEDESVRQKKISVIFLMKYLKNTYYFEGTAGTEGCGRAPDGTEERRGGEERELGGTPVRWTQND